MPSKKRMQAARMKAQAAQTAATEPNGQTAPEQASATAAPLAPALHGLYLSDRRRRDEEGRGELVGIQVAVKTLLHRLGRPADQAVVELVVGTPRPLAQVLAGVTSARAAALADLEAVRQATATDDADAQRLGRLQEQAALAARELDQASAKGEAALGRAREALAEGNDPRPDEVAYRAAQEEQTVLANRLQALTPALRTAEARATLARRNALERRRAELARDAAARWQALAAELGGVVDRLLPELAACLGLLDLLGALRPHQARDLIENAMRT